MTNNKSTKFFLGLTTEENMMCAKSLATKILSKNLASCINFIKVESKYIWKNKLIDTEEVKLIIKFRSRSLEELKFYLNDNHSYEIPEFIYWEVKASESYYSWIDSTSFIKCDS